MIYIFSLVPGPGSYDNLPSISKDGKYPISKFHNSLATVINPPNSKRFSDVQFGKFLKNL
jgi:hypothetical protein